LHADALISYVATIRKQGGGMQRINKRRIWMLGMGLLLLSQLAHATEVSFAQAHTAFIQALNEKDGALDRATEKFRALLKEHPNHPVYLAYLGACKALEGRSAWLLWNKMRYGEQGLDQIDRALNALRRKHDIEKLQGVPLSLHTMFVAATTFLDMPDEVFHRRDRGKRLLQKIINHPAYALAPDDFKESVQYSWRNIQ